MAASDWPQDIKYSKKRKKYVLNTTFLRMRSGNDQVGGGDEEGAGGELQRLLDE